MSDAQDWVIVCHGLDEARPLHLLSPCRHTEAEARAIVARMKMSIWSIPVAMPFAKYQEETSWSRFWDALIHRERPLKEFKQEYLGEYWEPAAQSPATESGIDLRDFFDDRRGV